MLYLPVIWCKNNHNNFDIYIKKFKTHVCMYSIVSCDLIRLMQQHKDVYIYISGLKCIRACVSVCMGICMSCVCVCVRVCVFVHAGMHKCARVQMFGFRFFFLPF